MHKSRLIYFIKTLSKGEFRKFREYVESPYFNQNPLLLRLIEILAQASPSFQGELLSKNHVFTQLFGEDAEYDDQKLQDQMSNMTRLFEQFIAQQSYEKSDQSQRHHLLNALDKRGMQAHLSRVFKRSQKQLLDSPLQDTSYFSELFEMGKNSVYFAAKKQNRRFKEGLSDAVSHLDRYFLGERLKTTCEIINRQRILNQTYQPGLEKAIIQYLQEHNEGQVYLQTPAVSIYYQIFMMLTDDGLGESHFSELLHLLEQHSSLFSKREGQAMYAYAQNYCIQQINQGQAKYLATLFRIYQLLLDKELLLNSEGYLAHEHYKNITTVGLKQKEFEWVVFFLESYKLKLPPEYRENAYNYNYSVYLYEKRRYSEVLKLLQRVVFTDVYYHLSAKFLLLRIYYEQNDADGIRYLTQAFLALLKRNKKISTYQSQAYRNLIRFTKKAFRLKVRKDNMLIEEFQERLAKLKQDIHASKGISNANWLLAKINELHLG